MNFSIGQGMKVCFDAAFKLYAVCKYLFFMKNLELSQFYGQNLTHLCRWYVQANIASF